MCDNYKRGPKKHNALSANLSEVYALKQSMFIRKMVMILKEDYNCNLNKCKYKVAI